MRTKKKSCKHCGKIIDFDVTTCPFCGETIEIPHVQKTQSGITNIAYQFLSPVVMVLLFIVLSLFSNLFGLSNEIVFIIGIALVVISTIFFDTFFKNQDIFILEIGKFISYMMLVFLTIIIFVIIKEGNVSDARLGIFEVIVFVSSLHLRVLKFDCKNFRFTYNKSIQRLQDYGNNMGKRYPNVSPYFIYRIELYIMLLLVSLIFLAFSLVDSLTVILATAAIDFIIYFFLSKFTNLLEQH